MAHNAKTASLWGQVIMAMWVGGWCAFGFITGGMAITVYNVLLSGIGIAASFSPVYLSIWLDAISQIRHGPVKEN